MPVLVSEHVIKVYPHVSVGTLVDLRKFLSSSSASCFVSGTPQLHRRPRWLSLGVCPCRRAPTAVVPDALGCRAGLHRHALHLTQAGGDQTLPGGCHPPLHIHSGSQTHTGATGSGQRKERTSRIVVRDVSEKCCICPCSLAALFLCVIMVLSQRLSVSAILLSFCPCVVIWWYIQMKFPEKSSCKWSNIKSSCKLMQVLESSEAGHQRFLSLSVSPHLDLAFRQHV